MLNCLVRAIGIAMLAGAASCSNYRDNAGSAEPAQTADAFPSDSGGTVDRFRKRDPSLAKFFDTAYGYVVFPKIAKGGAGIGAANGSGEAFEQGTLVGKSEVSQVTLGLQLGGQTYSQIIFFQDKSYMDVFKDGHFEFSANASAIAVESGTGATNDFTKGVAVFTMPRGGLMFEASIGGQKFTFSPLK